MVVFAQPVLRKTTLPAPFKSFTMVPCDTTGVRIGAPGTGQVWNYTTLMRRGTDSITTTYTDKSGLTPVARMRFPNAEVVVIDDTTTYIYRTVDNKWRLDGWITPNTEMLAGADPYDVRPVEIVFNDPSSDVFIGTLQSPFPTPGAKNVTGSHAYIYDGFGQLALPDRTYTNVARITQRDSMTAEITLGVQKGSIKTTTRKTSWQEVSSNVPLFIIEESTTTVVNANNVTLFGPFNQRSVRYRRYTEPTDVHEDPDNALLVVPSPSYADVIAVKGLRAEPENISVINSIGELMECPMVSSGTNVHIDVRQLATGSYTVVVTDGRHIRMASFIRMP
jgi:hypothetical protein